MAVVHIPALLLSVTGGERELIVNGTTVLELIDQLEIRHPGIKRRLVEGDRLRAGLSVFVDGAVRRDGLMCEVSPQSEVHFIPAIAGGTLALMAGYNSDRHGAAAGLPDHLQSFLPRSMTE